jgi:hypothetical protein
MPHDCPRHHWSTKSPVARAAACSRSKNNPVSSKPPLPQTTNRFLYPKTDVLSGALFRSNFLNWMDLRHLLRPHRAEYAVVSPPLAPRAAALLSLGHENLPPNSSSSWSLPRTSLHSGLFFDFFSSPILFGPILLPKRVYPATSLPWPAFLSLGSCRIRSSSAFPNCPPRGAAVCLDLRPPIARGVENHVTPHRFALVPCCPDRRSRISSASTRTISGRANSRSAKPIRCRRRPSRSRAKKSGCQAARSGHYG